MRILLDPTGEVEVVGRERVARPVSLVGQTIGLLDISKPRGDVFLAALAEMLRDKEVDLRHYTKPTYTRPAPVELQQQIATECDLLIEALAD